MRLLIAIIAILLAATYAGAEPVTINLAKFRQHGLGRIHQVYTAVAIRRELGVWYSDVAASLDHLPAFDHSALEYRVVVDPAALPEPGLIVVYQAGLNGHENLYYAKTTEGTESYYAVNSGLATFKPSVTPDQAKAIVTNLQKAFPRGKFELFGAIGVVSFSSPAPAEFSAIFSAAKASKYVAAAELNGVVYRAPFHVEASRYIAAGTETKSIAVDTLRTFTAEFLKNGGCFASQTSLPAPFGPGWVANPNCTSR